MEQILNIYWKRLKKKEFTDGIYLVLFFYPETFFVAASAFIGDDSSIVMESVNRVTKY